MLIGTWMYTKKQRIPQIVNTKYFVNFKISLGDNYLKQKILLYDMMD